MNILTLLLSLYLSRNLQIDHVDLLYLDNLKIHEIKSKKITVPAGFTTIEVIIPNDYHINCQYQNIEGAVGYYADNVTHCQANANFDKPTELNIIVQNREKRDIDYRIHISN